MENMSGKMVENTKECMKKIKNMDMGATHGPTKENTMVNGKKDNKMVLVIIQNRVKNKKLVIGKKV